MSYADITSTGLELLDEFNQYKCKAIEEGKNDYSLINAMLKKTNEVNLHSGFIYSMINPNSLHYQGTKYLELFLQNLPDYLQGFINIADAEVFKEKDSIDLLITDGTHYLIVENKITAPDQRYQISRYICTVIERFNIKENLGEHIAVVYLSKNKSLPSKGAESLIGFDMSDDKKQLIRDKSTELPLNDKLDGLKLIPNYEVFDYFHMPYLSKVSQKCCLESWVDDCIKVSSGHSNLEYAFTEYKEILNRLASSYQWKKIMSFDEYVLEQTEEKQDEIYELMVQSRKSLTRYVARKLYSQLLECFGEEVINNQRDKKRLSEESIEKWLNKKGKKDDWQNIGFLFTYNETEYEFFFGESYVYLLPVGEGYEKTKNCICKSNARKLLLETKDGLSSFTKEVSKRYKEISKLCPSKALLTE